MMLPTHDAVELRVKDKVNWPMVKHLVEARPPAARPVGPPAKHPPWEQVQAAVSAKRHHLSAYLQGPWISWDMVQQVMDDAYGDFSGALQHEMEGVFDVKRDAFKLWSQPFEVKEKPMDEVLELGKL